MKNAAGVLVASRATGRVLLGLRSAHTKNPGMWAVFGGRVERGEDGDEAASRELMEEANIGVEPEELELLHERERDGGTYQTFLWVVEDESDIRVRLNDEHEDVDWFSLDDLPEPLHEGAEALFDELGDELLDLIDEW